MVSWPQDNVSSAAEQFCQINRRLPLIRDTPMLLRIRTDQEVSMIYKSENTARICWLRSSTRWGSMKTCRVGSRLALVPKRFGMEALTFVPKQPSASCYHSVQQPDRRTVEGKISRGSFASCRLCAALLFVFCWGGGHFARIVAP